MILVLQLISILVFLNQHIEQLNIMYHRHSLLFKVEQLFFIIQFHYLTFNFWKYKLIEKNKLNIFLFNALLLYFDNISIYIIDETLNKKLPFCFYSIYVIYFNMKISNEYEKIKNFSEIEYCLKNSTYSFNLFFKEISFILVFV